MSKNKSIALLLCGVLIATNTMFSFANNAIKNKTIGAEKAKAIALKHSKVKKANFVKAKLETEDGNKVYDVEFYANGIEYDYEINAYNGSINHFDQEIEDFIIPNKSVKKGKIGIEKAKLIAEKHAELNLYTAVFKSAKFEKDDGVGKYELEFVFGGIEYNYEIEAQTGKILSFESEIMD